jgi:hypothetical protein
MKHPVRLLIPLALLLTAAPRLAAAQEWKPYSNDECRCSAQFPGTPQQRNQPMRTNLGNLDAKMVTLEVPDAFYAIAFVDYPKDKLDKSKATPEDLLNGARDGAVANVKGQLAKETKITMNGYPGRDLRIEAPGDLLLLARIYMVKERLYQSLVVMPKSRESGADAQKFLDSF